MLLLTDYNVQYMYGIYYYCLVTNLDVGATLNRDMVALPF
jgi:hypothetical protein